MNSQHRRALAQLAEQHARGPAHVTKTLAGFTVPISAWVRSLPFVRGLEARYGVRIVGEDAGEVSGRVRVAPVIRHAVRPARTAQAGAAEEVAP